MDTLPLDIPSLMAAYRAGTLDPVAVTQACLARIDQLDGTYHAFITVARERALSDARASAARWREGRPLGPLDGIPVALKDNIQVAGMPCTGGSAALRDDVPAQDAPVQSRLAAAGAVLLGKLNMHEGALGATTDNLAFGRCINPLHAGHTPGGSSGGSGAALAAGFCSVAIGSDTMGSVRVPASYCGVFGYKPGNDTVPHEGMVPLCHVLDVAGPLATTARDTALAARVLMGLPPEPGAPATWSGLRIGVPMQMDAITLHPEVAEGFRQFLAAVAAQGAIVRRIDLPHWDPTRSRRAGLLAGEADALAWWKHMKGDDLPGLSAPFAAMLRYADRAGPEKVAAARATLESLYTEAAGAFSDIDLMALPTTPHPSFEHTDSPPIDQADLTALANFYRCGAFAFPIECQGRAVSVQLMAAPGDDQRLLALAEAIDRLGRASSRYPHARLLEG